MLIKARLFWGALVLSTLLLAGCFVSAFSGNISAIWANEGGDKVTRAELRASRQPDKVINSVWNGTGISIFGARNEVVNFNLVIEADTNAAVDVNVTFDKLTGPEGAVISSKPVDRSGLFNWVDRNIELFYVDYLQIRGLSLVNYDIYDERHIPERLQRPWVGEGEGSGGWTDRPDHNAFYPDIAIPLELKAGFTIAAQQNQSIWVDIYIPAAAPAGLYTGALRVIEGTVTRDIPVQLTVRDFTLPNIPYAQTMLHVGYADVNLRYLGVDYPDADTEASRLSTLIMDRHFMLAHRHRIALIGAGEYADDTFHQPTPGWMPRLTGELFTPINGYDGPGVGTSNGIYSIGTYGEWSWQDEDEAAMWQHSDAWVTWFEDYLPEIDYFLYLKDESLDYALTEQWAHWLDNNPGPGRLLPSLATSTRFNEIANIPSLDIAVGLAGSGITEEWQKLADYYTTTPGKLLFYYNGARPASGTFSIEDDGIALRQLAWGQYKMGIDRWFYWESTYYNNTHGATGQTNVFTTAHTYGEFARVDAVVGETGTRYANGEGVLFYPGTDTMFPEQSYGIQGPIASLRLKYWRRGIQDVDYLALAYQINPVAVRQIVDTLVPKVLWEYNEEPDLPGQAWGGISWSTDPGVWEDARERLADIIESGS